MISTKRLRFSSHARTQSTALELITENLSLLIYFVGGLQSSPQVSLLVHPCIPLALPSFLPPSFPLSVRPSVRLSIPLFVYSQEMPGHS